MTVLHIFGVSAIQRLGVAMLCSAPSTGIAVAFACLIGGDVGFLVVAIVTMQAFALGKTDAFHLPYPRSNKNIVNSLNCNIYIHNIVTNTCFYRNVKVYLFRFIIISDV